jgi:aspartyl-tRNA(Asn)/glutamyl-tRNA(Gln) amidotransferase subunit C
VTLSIKEVEHVALLARLNLSEEEKQKYALQLGAILEHVEVLKRLPTDNVEPMAHVLPLFNVMRADRKGPSFPKQEILANAPEQEDGHFKVPRIV